MCTFITKMFAKFIVLLIALHVIISVTNAAAVVPRETENKTKKPWDLLEALTATAYLRSFNGTWITDDEFYYTAADRSIYKYNAAANNATLFVPSVILELYGSRSSFTVSPDNNLILIRYDVESVFRHSSIAKYDIFNLATTQVKKIHNGKKLQYCQWSPSKGRLAYVYENNVYVHFEDGNEIQLTKDGITGIIYNGVPDWVYEEEVLSSSSALWWSPDGLKLAVGHFNDTNVGTFNYAIYGNTDPSSQYPREENLKYPKPGTPNPEVELRLFDVTDKNANASDALILNAPKEIVTGDHIMQNVVWIDNTSVLVLWLNRRQNLLSMQRCSLLGRCLEVKRFAEPSGWIKIDTPICQSSGETCVFTYWIGEWQQAWKLNLRTGENLWKSRGNFTITSIYGYDDKEDKLYYQATLKGHPYIKHIFVNDQCLSCDTRDVDMELCSNAVASFSDNFSYYSVSCSGPGPRYVQIFETKTNRLVKDWEPNTAFRRLIASKLNPDVLFMNVTLPDGSMGVVQLKFPPHMDVKKKYPMIVNVYGGPDSERVNKVFGVGFDAYITTSRNVIYAFIDGRGTANKGKPLLYSVNNNLGHFEVEDQIAITKFLQNSLPFVDRDRTGIWGWSYGGYISAKTLATDKERVFQCGIAVAPVTSWLYYDSIYTERYMGLPTPDDNLKNYYESSVFKNVENIKTHDFMLIHGSADDNVHYQQSLQLAKVLQSKDILFEQMTYTDENHAIGSFTPHLYHTMEHFWNNCLGLDMSEEETV